MLHAKLLRSALVVLSIGLTSACGGSVFNQPEVTLQSVQVGGLGIRGGTLLVSVQVINPNRFSLSADELNYQLAVNDPDQPSDTTWIDFANGTYGEGFSVGARDTAVVQIPVEFSYAALGAAAGSIARAGTFTYRATGTVDVRTPLGTHQVPFRKRGTVALLGPQ
jgi:LEA14-like dessication related protein